MFRIGLTSFCCILAGFISSVFINWDWSFILIPTLISLAVSLSNFDKISFPKKLIGILLHWFLSMVIFVITICVTVFILSPMGLHAMYVGSALAAILFALITNILLPFPKFWLSMVIIFGLSLLVWPIADYMHAHPTFKLVALDGRENIITIWYSIVGFGVASGIHRRKYNSDDNA
ncbi:hypothetical protein [Sphingobacterium sp. DR205]|uniref:hypothetical protein n=1 Tax=Sphingobacterium sp. DR205 TaxID=2713573 RepID=UPI0013E426B8|nr:hypothetical protein [Sphingobacterium sp. DR205]QIH34176.1 hypothetical protein G6053_15335 [Sphingobacterium sp. DR205]